MRKKLAAAAVGASLLAGGAAGAMLMAPVVATAADENSSGSSSSENGSGTETERPEPGQWVKDALQELVDAGTITEAQATAVAEKLEASRPEHGPMRGFRGRGPGLSVAAEAIGIEESALLEALQGGDTIADVARANDVDVQTVIDAIVAEMNSHLDQAVTDGRLTQEQADERKAGAAERATDLVNGELRARGPMGPGGPPPGVPGAFGDGATDDGAATSTSPASVT